MYTITNSWGQPWNGERHQMLAEAKAAIRKHTGWARLYVREYPHCRYEAEKAYSVTRTAKLPSEHGEIEIVQDGATA